MPLTSQELATASACLDSCIPDGQKQAVIIYLLATIAGVPTDAQTLVTNAACLDSCIPAGMGESVIISLLDTINSEAIIAGDNITCGASDPSSIPASGCAFYINTSTDAVWIYRNGAWALKV